MESGKLVLVLPSNILHPRPHLKENLIMVFQALGFDQRDFRAGKGCTIPTQLALYSLVKLKG